MNAIFKRVFRRPALAGLVTFVCVGALLAPVRFTEAANPIGSTEITQLANNIELVAILGKEAQQLLKLIETYQLMLQEAQMLPDIVQRNAIAALMNLARSTELGMAISYASANVGQELKDSFQGLEEYRDFLADADNEQRVERFQDVMQSTYDTVQAALENAGLQSQMFDDESVAVAAMQRQMATAQGQNQILQAGFSMAAAQVEQMQKLRQLVMAQSNMQGAAIAAEMDQRAKEAAALDRSKKRSIRLDPDNETPLTAGDLF